MKRDRILEPTGFCTWAIHSSILDNIKQHYQHKGDTFFCREKMDFWFFVSVFCFFVLDCRLPWQWYDLLNTLNFSFKCIMFRKPQFVAAFFELPWISFFLPWILTPSLVRGLIETHLICVVYIFLVFPNACCVLSHCNIRLGLHNLLIHSRVSEQSTPQPW